MKISRKRTSAFTLAELVIAAGVAVILSVGFVMYSSSALRMMIRNLATNHSHETARASLEKLLSHVHNSATRFQLINFDGTNYSDVTAAVINNSDQDAYTQQYISNRANGVRFMVAAGGPFKIVGNGTTTAIASTDTTVQFDFGSSAYTPLAGDKVRIPLLAREFDITGTPVKSGTLWTVTLSGPIGNSLTTTTTNDTPPAPAITTGVFYHRVAYFVWNNQLLYDPGYPPPPYPTAPTSASPFAPPPTPPVKQMSIVKTNVTSPSPFALLFSTRPPTATPNPTPPAPVTDASNLRVSLESYDLQYGARLLQDGTTTVQAVIPSRNRPTVLSSN